jgi:hypothetical protein
MKNTSSFVQSLCLMLIISFVSFPAISLAGDTDPDGVKLMLLHEEPKFKADLKESGAANTDWFIVCELEAGTGVGAIIWNTRRKADKCSSETRKNDAITYCAVYSMSCPHYSWDSNCLLDKIGKMDCM